MTLLADDELTELGRDVACQFLGADKVIHVEVVAGADWSGDPAYDFWYQLEQGPDRERAALERIRLGQKLRDELIARGDTTYPYIHVVDGQDWDKRRRA